MGRGAIGDRRPLLISGIFKSIEFKLDSRCFTPAADDDSAIQMTFDTYGHLFPSLEDDHAKFAAGELALVSAA